MFLGKLKEDGVLLVRWIPTSKNEAELFTKNLDGPLFTKFAKAFNGDDKH